jgi:hypothetical protein
MTFSFNARYALLTYAQCGTLDPWSVSDHFTELRGECIVAREAHADGGTHLHAFVDFGRKFRSRRSDVFDVDGFHPNVSPTYSTPQVGFDYACKDGDVVAGGLARPEGSVSSTAVSRWHDITSARSREEFFQLLLEHAPRDLCTSFTSLSKYADWMYRDDPSPYKHDDKLESSASDFPELGAWVQDSLNEFTVGRHHPRDRLSRRPQFVIYQKGDGWLTLTLTLTLTLALTLTRVAGILTSRRQAQEEPRSTWSESDGEDTVGEEPLHPRILWRSLLPRRVARLRRIRSFRRH